MNTSNPILELIEIESADFASRVYDVMEDGNDFCKSTMVVVIDELVSDLISQAQDTADQVKMLSVIRNASRALRDVMLDEKEG
tara:strand:- start:1043 stop:1291 length:249 start_codon:yes stop_codon:yes gene_type:complete